MDLSSHIHKHTHNGQFTGYIYKVVGILPFEDEVLPWRLFKARRPCKGMSPPSRTLL